MLISTITPTWELYRSSSLTHTRRAVAIADRALDAAFKDAAQAVMKGMTVPAAMARHMEKVMDAHAAAGSADSEPYNQAWEALKALA